MLLLSLLAMLVSVPLFSYTITSTQYSRVAGVVFLISSLMSYNSVDLAYDVPTHVYNGSFLATNITTATHCLLLLVCSALSFVWAPAVNHNTATTSGVHTATPSVPEHTLLLLFSGVGAVLLVSSYSFISLFISLELQSLALYVLCTLYRHSESSTAAGLKYLLLGGFSSSVIVLGTGLVYLSTGVTEYSQLEALLSTGAYTSASVLGMTLVLLGLLFKVAAAPMHYWAPDVYDGTPTVITAWIAVVPKISLFSVLYVLSSLTTANWVPLLVLAALLSLLVGTVLGLTQYRLKRLLTYSTVSHVGFLLLALSVPTVEGEASYYFYLLTYSLSNAALFGLVLATGYQLSRDDARRATDLEAVQDLRGLAYVNPAMALGLAMILFSMAGIPPMVGFFAKFNVLYSAVSQGYYVLAVVAVVSSVISAYYYLRLVQLMYFSRPAVAATATTPAVSPVHATMVSLGTAAVVGYLLYPSVLLNASTLLVLGNYALYPSTYSHHVLYAYPYCVHPPRACRGASPAGCQRAVRS